MSSSNAAMKSESAADIMREKQRRADCKAKGIDPDANENEAIAERSESDHEEEKIEELEWTEPPKSKNNFIDCISTDKIIGDGITHDLGHNDAIMEFTCSTKAEC